MGYKLSASLLNRKKAPGKVTDGLALFFKRNNDGTLSAIQRVKRNGKESDVTIAVIVGDITQERLQQIRADAYAAKVGGGEVAKAITFEDAWNSFYKAVTSAQNSKGELAGCGHPVVGAMRADDVCTQSIRCIGGRS